MKIVKEDRAGLYITVIFHLAVIIILLCVQIGRELARENSFVLDFTKQEMLEKEQKEEIFKEDISKKLDELISNAPNVSARSVRNIAVDGSSQLKDDRNTDADQLYKDAARLAKELKDGTKQAIEENAVDEAVETGHHEKSASEKKEYSGPSVLSYTLDGRKASHLSIPAYRCNGGGQVTVIIAVNNAGTVVDAKIREEGSSDDGCLRNFAIRAARLSKFSASSSAPAKQMGEIVYQFIAQY